MFSLLVSRNVSLKTPKSTWPNMLGISVWLIIKNVLTVLPQNYVQLAQCQSSIWRRNLPRKRKTVCKFS